jgi:acyl-CoA synthetase (AMP-forming)/AMP-acid ligase II
MNISAEEVEGLLRRARRARGRRSAGRMPSSAKPSAPWWCRAPGAEVSLDALVAHLRDVQKVAVYKLPQHVVVLDALPRSPAGKVLKGQLRQMVAAS